MEFEGNDQRNLVRTLSDHLLPRAGGGSPSAEDSRRPSFSEDVSARVRKKAEETCVCVV